MNKSQEEIKTLLINNLKECLSYLSPEVEQQVSKERDIAKLLTSITKGINLVKNLVTGRKGIIRWKREYYTILQLINEEERKGRSYTKTQFCHFFEDSCGLKSHLPIRKHINVLAAEGYIKFREKEVPENNKRIKVMELPVT